MSNGQNATLENSLLTNDDAPYDSESDLSEVAIPIIDAPSPATSSNHQSEFGGQETDASDSSPENQNGSDDADFDLEDSPAPAATNPSRDDRSTSIESRRPAKRKHGVESDHFNANPELYGLRRSVCISDVCTHIYQANCTSLRQARPILNRPIVCLPQSLQLRLPIHLLIFHRLSPMKTRKNLALISSQHIE